VVVVSAIGGAEGAPGAAGALACAASTADRAALLIDLRGRPPRPTVVASAAARALESRLAAHLIGVRVAARGRVCWLAPRSEEGDLDLIAAAAGIARQAPTVLLASARDLQRVVGDGSLSTAVLLRANADSVVGNPGRIERELDELGLEVAVLGQRLGWVVERRALFGSLAASSPDGLPGPLLTGLLGKWAPEAPGEVAA
jgi:hypothetical protein